jgi:hypothetical protein
MLAPLVTFIRDVPLKGKIGLHGFSPSLFD